MCSFFGSSSRSIRGCLFRSPCSSQKHFTRHSTSSESQLLEAFSKLCRRLLRRLPHAMKRKLLNRSDESSAKSWGQIFGGFAPPKSSKTHGRTVFVSLKSFEAFFFQDRIHLKTSTCFWQDRPRGILLSV